MKLPPGKVLRIEMVGLEDGRVELGIYAVARGRGAEVSRRLAQDEYADTHDAMRAVRDWVTARIVIDAEAHAPAEPPVFDVPAPAAVAREDAPF